MGIIKHAAAALLCALLLAGCAKQQEPLVPLEEIPADYTLEQAKEDGCVIHENGDISSGQEVWEDFLKTSSAGKAASVRLVYYHTLDDNALDDISRHNSEYYESIKDVYPLMLIRDLSFDGEQYTTTGLDNGEWWEQTYSYLKKYEDEAETPNASYDAYIRYVLVNDEDVTWDRLIWGAFSSRSDDHIPFTPVYTDYIYNDSENT